VTSQAPARPGKWLRRLGAGRGGGGSPSASVLAVASCSKAAKDGKQQNAAVED